jgi:hypothetical protein
MRPSRYVLLVGSMAIGGCFGAPASPCHEQMIARHGCCPLCDVDCRAAVDAACADDEHEPDEREDDPDAPRDPDEPEPEETDVE